MHYKVLVEPVTGEFECLYQNTCTLERCLCDVQFAVKTAKSLVQRRVGFEVEATSGDEKLVNSSCISIQTLFSALTKETFYSMKIKTKSSYIFDDHYSFFILLLPK